MKKFLSGIARALCVMSVCVIAGCSYAGDGGSGSTPPVTPSGNGGLVGTPTNGQLQGAIAKETWMASNGNLMIENASGQKVEITKTSEVVVIPTGTVAKINMTQEDAKGDLFTDSRKVKLSSFVMSQYQVTRGLFKAVMGEEYFTNLGTQATANGTADENPVTQINWFEAIVFCNKLSRLCHLEPVYSYDFSTDGSGKMTDPEDWFKDTTNLSETVPTSDSSTNYANWKDKVVINLKANGYRLPTEAEWEFCARGGDPNEEDWGYTYSGSNTVTEVAWYEENSNYSGTNIVGCMDKANKLGLYDMSGNVWEWCDDYYNSNVTVDDTQYTDSEGYVKDPLVVFASSYRGLRGGSWEFNASYCECGYRKLNSSFSRFNYYGFRLVRSTN
ncbi:MAG: formylglycine-generating enzyme family protein [Treponema sp.]|nr:formylglycine-generating enzyme family protein [Candidatus Treponema scatequi]